MRAVAEPLQKSVATDRDIICSGVDCRVWVGGDEAAEVGDGEFERYARTTRRAAFLAEMERIVPRPVLCALIHPSDPKRNGR